MIKKLILICSMGALLSTTLQANDLVKYLKDRDAKELKKQEETGQIKKNKIQELKNKDSDNFKLIKSSEALTTALPLAIGFYKINDKKTVNLSIRNKVFSLKEGDKFLGLTIKSIYSTHVNLLTQLGKSIDIFYVDGKANTK